MAEDARWLELGAELDALDADEDEPLGASAVEGAEGGGAEDEGYDSGGTFSGGLSDGGAAAALGAAVTSALVDPPTTGLFTLFIGAVPGIAFTECAGLSIENETIEVREGGVNASVRRLPGQTSHGSLTFRREYVYSAESLPLHLWRERINSDTRLGMNTFTRTGLVLLYNDAHRPVGAWCFSNGIIQRWSGPDLRAGSNSTAVEELQIAHEGLTIIDLALQASELAFNVLEETATAADLTPSLGGGAFGLP